MGTKPLRWNPESVAWITANAQRLLEDQQRRAESLQTRAGQLAGFAGATAALTAPLGAKVTNGAHQHVETAAALVYFGALGALALAIALSVVFVLRPVTHYALGSKEIHQYVTDSRFLTQSPAEIQFRTLKAVKRATERYEKVNHTKSVWLRVASTLFLAGLLLTIAVASMIVIDQLCDTTMTPNLVGKTQIQAGQMSP